MEIAEVENTFKLYLEIGDSLLIRTTLSLVAANRLKGDPVWLFLVAPSSSLKTEMIQALFDLPFVEDIGFLTDKVLVSGIQGKSLLSPTLHNKILAFKDFQAILSLYSEVKSRVLAQLREIFDGKVISRYGHGEKIVWQGKLGFIAGVTETIDREFTLHRALGERFLYFRIRPPGRKKAALAAISSYPIVEEMRKEFRRKIREFFESLETSKSGSLKLESYLRREDKEEIAILSSFLGKARTEIIREQGRIETLLDPEGPGRIARSLTALFKGALALRLSRSEAKQIVRRVVLDTIPKMRAYVMKNIEGPETLTSLQKKTRLPISTLSRILEDLNLISLISSDGKVYSFHSKIFKTLIKSAKEADNILPLNTYK